MQEIMYPRKTYGLLYGLKNMEEDVLVCSFPLGPLQLQLGIEQSSMSI